jgi:hypothetical protein
MSHSVLHALRTAYTNINDLEPLEEGTREEIAAYHRELHDLNQYCGQMTAYIHGMASASMPAHPDDGLVLHNGSGTWGKPSFCSVAISLSYPDELELVPDLAPNLKGHEVRVEPLLLAFSHNILQTPDEDDGSSRLDRVLQTLMETNGQAITLSTFASNIWTPSKRRLQLAEDDALIYLFLGYRKYSTSEAVSECSILGRL